jgi:hypothetical protein
MDENHEQPKKHKGQSNNNGEEDLHAPFVSP